MTELENLPRSVQEWIRRATKKLPENIATEAADELVDHCTDAITDVMAKGGSEEEAAQIILEKMGSASKVADGFHDTYLGFHRYRISLLLCGLILFAYLSLPAVYELTGAAELAGALLVLMIIYDLLVIVPAIFVLASMRSLLTWRFHERSHGKAVSLAVTGLIFIALVDTITAALYDYSLTLGVGQPPNMSMQSSFIEKLLVFGDALAYLLLGAGLTLLAVNLIRMPHRLYGLRWPLAVVALIIGLPMVLAPLWLQFHLPLLQELSYSLVLIGQIIIWPMLLLTFYRALNHLPPTQLT